MIVEQWNSIPLEKPLSRNRDLVRFLRKAFAGERVDEDFDTFSVRGFRLGFVPDPAPAVLVAGLRGNMLALASEEADGVIINWLSAADVEQVVPIVNARGPRQVVARMIVAATADADVARAMGRRLITTYLNVPVYRAFQEWLGRDDLEPMWKLWAAGERKEALAAVPDHVVDDLVLHVPPAEIREHLQRFVAHGVTTPVAMPLPVLGVDPRQVCRDLAPR